MTSFKLGLMAGTAALAVLGSSALAQEVTGGNTDTTQAMSSNLRAVSQARLDGADTEKTD